MSEIIYRKLSEVASKRLEEARAKELEGVGGRDYEAAARELEVRLFTAYRLPERAVRLEMLAKIELARGKQAQIDGIDPKGFYKRSHDHLGVLVSSLGARGTDGIVRGYFQQAIEEVAQLMGAETEQVELSDIVRNMPVGIANQLKDSKMGAFDMHYTSSVQDTVYGESEDYKVVVAFWEEHSWSDRAGGGIAWDNWLSVHFSPKGTEELYNTKTETIRTRGHSQSEDKSYLWKYGQAGLEVLEGNRISAYWRNEAERGPSYTLDLDGVKQRLLEKKDA